MSLIFLTEEKPQKQTSNHPQTSETAKEIQPTDKNTVITDEFNKLVIQKGNSYFLIKDRQLTPVQEKDYQPLRVRDFIYPFTITSKNQQLYYRDNKSLQEEKINYTLKEEGNLLERFDEVVYDTEGEKAIIRISTIDKTDPGPEIGGGPDPLKITEYQYDYKSNSLVPSNIFTEVYNILEVTPPTSNLQPRPMIMKWESTKDIIYAMEARYGEGGDGALQGFYVVNLNKKMIVSYLKPETEESIEIPTVFPNINKLATIKFDHNKNTYRQKIYDLKTLRLFQEINLPLNKPYVRVEPVEFSSDEKKILLFTENYDPHVIEVFVIDTEAGQTKSLYIDDTVTSSMTDTLPSYPPHFSRNDQGLYYTDSSNLHQQPPASRLMMKAEDDRYYLKYVDINTKEQKTFYESSELIGLAGYLK